MRLPIGSCPGKNCCAAAALMITTGVEVASSCSLKYLPRSREEPRVLKKSALIQQPSACGECAGSFGLSSKISDAPIACAPGRQSELAALVAPGSVAAPWITARQNAYPSGPK